MSAARMHPDELDLDEPLVRRLLERDLPQWAHLPLEPVQPRGTDNALYRLGDDLVVRLPRRESTTATLEKELRWLPTLAPLLPLEVPIPVTRGTPTAEYPFVWAVYRWLEGENATSDRIVDARRFAEELAHFVATLQGIDTRAGPPPGPHNFFRGEPPVHRDDAVRAAIATLGPARDADEVTAAWNVAVAAPDWSGTPVWIHGDLDSRNLLVRRGRLACVLDFGCLGVGDPACDVMAAWKLLTADERGLFRTILAVDEATWCRARGWALSQALSALAYYTPETNPTLVEEAECWLDEVLADSSV